MAKSKKPRKAVKTKTIKAGNREIMAKLCGFKMQYTLNNPLDLDEKPANTHVSYVSGSPVKLSVAAAYEYVCRHFKTMPCTWGLTAIIEQEFEHGNEEKRFHIIRDCYTGPLAHAHNILAPEIEKYLSTINMRHYKKSHFRVEVLPKCSREKGLRIMDKCLMESTIESELREYMNKVA